jgi:hypothetical protein
VGGAKIHIVHYFENLSTKLPTEERRTEGKMSHNKSATKFIQNKRE